MQKPKKIALLMELAENLPLIRANGVGYTTIQRKEQKATIPIQGGEFKKYLKSAFFDKYGDFPPDVSVKNVADYLTNRAMELDQQEAKLRVAEKDGALYYDLCDGSCVKIANGTWSIVANDLNLFLRGPDQLPQVRPEAGKGNINLLRKYINLPDDDWVLYVPYLCYCFISGVQYPIFVINGPNGSGKSELSRVTKSLIDPAVNEVETMNNVQDNISVRLNSAHYLAFDNLSGLSKPLSDYFCGVATGISTTKRMHFENFDTVTMKLEKPICFNGILDFVKQPDLAERSLFFNTKKFNPATRRELGEFRASFEADKPYILAGIFDLVATAHETSKTATISGLTRMTEFHKTGRCIAEAMGGYGEEFEARLKMNTNKQIEIVYGNSVVLQLLDDFLDPGEIWDSNIGKLYKCLRSYMDTDADEYYIKSQYPKDAARFGSKLRDLEGVLTSYGISIDFYHNQDNYSCVKLMKAGITKEESQGSDKIIRIPIVGLRKAIIRAM